ncbi:MAG: stage II sporulation protein R [Clostridia bacterium]|nr:stage II sporulation protein R [Clostridia bacterium]
MKRNLQLLEIAALLAMGLCVLLALTGAAESRDRISGAVLRLHVIANSDSAADQSVKLAVRDALLKESETLAAAGSKRQAEHLTERLLQRFQHTAERTVRNSGSSDPVRVSLERAAFPTRTYGGVTLPAGDYDALRVVIGKGEGQNWWCVMFPPLCLPAAEKSAELEDVLDEEALALAQREPRFELRFWLLEQWEQWKQKREQKGSITPG